MTKKTSVKITRTHGRNQRLGGSLISLGPHGGIDYVFRGSKDSYGLHKKKTYKVYSSNNQDEWRKYNQTLEERKRKEANKFKKYYNYQKKAGRRRKHNSWPSIAIDVYYYHQENLILKDDSFLLKEAHYCNSKECTITKINNGKVSIRCNKCKARKRILSSKFLMLYYNACKRPYESKQSES